MIRVSNTIVGFLNIITLISGITSVGAAIYIHVHGAESTDCQKFLREPLLYIGVALFLLSLVGMVGSCCCNNVALYIYLLCMFLMIVGLTVFTIMSFVVTNKQVGTKVLGMMQYKIEDFPQLLRRFVLNGNNWYHIRSCLYDAHVCRNIVPHNHQNPDIKYSDYNLIQSGCCKPPVYCGLVPINATYWEVPKNGPVVEDSDCGTWSNRQDILCFECKACKGVVLSNIRQEWRHLTIFNSCVLILVTIIYCIGCCALRNNTSKKQKKFP